MRSNPRFRRYRARGQPADRTLGFRSLNQLKTFKLAKFARHDQRKWTGTLNHWLLSRHLWAIPRG